MRPVPPPVHLFATPFHFSRKVADLLRESGDAHLMAIFDLFNLFLKFLDSCGPALPKGSLCSSVLGLALGRRGICGWLATRLWSRGNYPFLRGDGGRRARSR